MVRSEKKVIELQPHPKQPHREANPFDLALGLQPWRTTRSRAADESRSQQMAAAASGSTQELAWRAKKKAA